MSEVAAGEIKFDELPKFSGPTETAAKTVNTKAPKNGQVSDEEKLAILKREKAKAEAGFASETADLARTTDENYRKKLQASIPAYVPDINSLNREISSITGEPAPGVINWAGMPKYAPPKNKDESSIGANAIAAGAGAAAGAYYGARKYAKTEGPIASDSLAAQLMEKRLGLPPGTISQYENKIYGVTNPQDIALEMARSINPATPPVETNTAAMTGALPASVRAEPSFGPLPKAPTSTYMAPGEGATQIYNYALSLGLSPTQAMQAVDNTKEEGGAHYIKSQARTGELKAQRMFPAGTTTLPEAPSVVVPIPTGGMPRQQPDVWKRPRAIGPMPGMNIAPVAQTNVSDIGKVTPGEPSAIPSTGAPALTDEQIGAKIRQGSAGAHALQKGANIGVRAGFGAPTAMQAYRMATQQQPSDWQQLLSLAGNALGTFGPLTSKVPFVGRIPVAGPLATLAQLPYAIKNREELFRALQKGDVMPPGIVTGTEASESAFPFSNLDRP